MNAPYDGGSIWLCPNACLALAFSNSKYHSRFIQQCKTNASLSL
jgi:hypothetical protein